MSTDTFLPSPSDRAFAYKGFRFYWFAIMATTFAVQIMSVSVGWQIYDITRDPIFLGYVGLAQFLPALTLVLVTGLVADTFPRRGIMAICLSVEAVCAGILFLVAASQQQEVWPIYAVLVTLGVARAFLAPASSSLAPNLVPPQALAHALAINSSAWQTASIVGPAVGGLLYGISGTLGGVTVPVGAIAYGTAAILIAIAVVLILMIPKPPQRARGQATSMGTLLAGFHYIWSEKVVLGAISLDLFAVLLGGAVALMPVYARDILDVGPMGLGLLRAAPGIGAIMVALILNRFPIRDRAGLILFTFVAAFGFFTVIFGFSTTVWISIPALFLIGACDMVSVVIRETLMQLWTPDDVRGRVSAVNSVFIGASNELGEFRAGMVAALIGAKWAVGLGGMGTIAVSAAWSRIFPGLRKARHLNKSMV